jgi:hypothetical protein
MYVGLTVAYLGEAGDPTTAVACDSLAADPGLRELGGHSVGAAEVDRGVRRAIPHATNNAYDAGCKGSAAAGQRDEAD